MNPRPNLPRTPQRRHGGALSRDQIGVLIEAANAVREHKTKPSKPMRRWLASRPTQSTTPIATS